MNTLPRQVRLLRCSVFSPGLPQRAQNAADRQKLDTVGYDISPYVQRIDIYESVFDNTISGSILLLENVGLVEYLPIVGVETVLLAFAIDDGHDTKEFVRTFRITKVHNQTYPRNDYRLYTLELATPEFVTSVSSRISRAFSGVTCCSAVIDILQNDMGVTDLNRIGTLEDTFGTVNIVIPFYTPLMAINYFTLLAQRDNTSRESNFFFFETLDGFHFTSLSKLISDGLAAPHIRTFNVDPGQMSTDKIVNAEAAMNAATRIHQEQAFDLLADIASGTLRSKMVHFDFLARKLDPDMDTSYTDSFAQNTHLDEHPVYPKNFDRTVSKNVRIFLVPSNAWTKDSKYIKSKADALPEQRMHEAIQMRNRQIREIQHLKTIIDLPGQPDLRAGTVVKVNYPSTRQLEDSGKANIPVYSTGTPYYSGAHLVTHVHHILAGSSENAMEYRMNIKVCKDSLGAPLIGSSNTGE